MGSVKDALLKASYSFGNFQKKFVLESPYSIFAEPFIKVAVVLLINDNQLNH